MHSRFYLSDTPIGVSRGWQHGAEEGGAGWGEQMAGGSWQTAWKGEQGAEVTK